MAGASLATLESLYHLYKTDPTAPATVHHVDRSRFIEAVRRTKTKISVGARQVLMKGKSGRLYRVLAIQYVAKVPGQAWLYQEARTFDRDGSVDISGTLLERLTTK